MNAPDPSNEAAELADDARRLVSNTDLADQRNVFRALDVIYSARCSLLPSMLQGSDRAALLEALRTAENRLHRQLIAIRCRQQG